MKKLGKLVKPKAKANSDKNGTKRKRVGIVTLLSPNRFPTNFLELIITKLISTNIARDNSF